MNITKNIFANYTGIAVTTCLTFLVVPFYLKWLGADSYGLIGVATLIQGWVMLFNVGLAPVVGRQAAQAHIGAANWVQAARFFRTVDWLMLALALPFILAVFFFRDWLAQHWFERSSLSAQTIELSLLLLVVTMLIRLATSVGRGIIANFEAQIWLNIQLVVFGILRFAVSLPIVYFWPNINVLFIWWLAVAVLEYVSIQHKISNSMPVSVPIWVFDVAELQKHGKMAGTLVVTGGIWVLVTNLDKLLLSGLLPLANYGYFSIATLLAGAVLILIQPISQAFQPRLTKAYADGGIDAVCSEFRRCTHWVILFVFPVGAVLFAMPETILAIWTGDPAMAASTATILRGYVIGNMLVVAGSLLYLVQVAIGNVRWHLQGNLIFALCLVPALPWIVNYYGAEGAAWLWAGLNLLLFIFWNVFLLKKIAQPLFPKWIFVDILLPLLTSLAVAWSANRIADTFFTYRFVDIVPMLAFVVVLTVFISGILWLFHLRKLA